MNHIAQIPSWMPPSPPDENPPMAALAQTAPAQLFIDTFQHSPSVDSYMYAPAENSAQFQTINTSNAPYYSNGFYQPTRLFDDSLPTLHSDSESSYYHVQTPASDLSSLTSPLYPHPVSSNIPMPDFSSVASCSQLPAPSHPSSPTSSLPSPSPTIDTSPSATPARSQSSVTKPARKGHRRIWNHALEKFLFSPEELATLGAPHRRTIYLASLEAHIDRLHLQLIELGLYPVPLEELHPYKGLNCKTAKGMVSGLQHDVLNLRMQIMEAERTGPKSDSSAGRTSGDVLTASSELVRTSRKFSLDSNMPMGY